MERVAIQVRRFNRARATFQGTPTKRFKQRFRNVLRDRSRYRKNTPYGECSQMMSSMGRKGKFPHLATANSQMTTAEARTVVLRWLDVIERPAAPSISSKALATHVAGIFRDRPPTRTQAEAVKYLIRLATDITTARPMQPRPSPPRAEAEPDQRRYVITRTVPSFYNEAETKKIQAFYASREWAMVRYEVLRAFGARCQCCGASAEDGRQIHVDHIRPLRGFWHLRFEHSNLQPLCNICNVGKGSRHADDWRI